MRELIEEHRKEWVQQNMERRYTRAQTPHTCSLQKEVHTNGRADKRSPSPQREFIITKIDCRPFISSFLATACSLSHFVSDNFSAPSFSSFTRRPKSFAGSFSYLVESGDGKMIYYCLVSISFTKFTGQRVVTLRSLSFSKITSTEAVGFS